MISVNDPGGERDRVVRGTHHPNYMAKESALVIFGRFHDGKGGLNSIEPVVIQPPPRWNTNVIIDVGPTRMQVVTDDS